MSEAPSQRADRADWIPLVAWGLGFLALAAARIHFHSVPQDLSAYLAAADILTSSPGESPYTLSVLETSPLYQGFPYLYYPGFHWLLRLLGALPLWLVLLVDTLTRGLLAACIIRVWVRELRVPLPWQGVVLGLLCLDAFVTDLYVGNLTVMMSVLWCWSLVGKDAVAARSDSQWVKRYLFAISCFFVGFLMILKPMWLLPAGFTLSWRRQWRGLGALVLGGVSALACGALVGGAELAAWWSAIGQVRAHWQAFDLGSISPVCMVVAACAWGLGAWRIMRTGRAQGWLWGSVSVLVWPRIGLYSYVIAIPLLLWSVRRFGKLRGALLAIPFSLLPSFLLAEYTVLRMCLVYVSTLALGGLWLLCDENDPEDAPDA